MMNYYVYNGACLLTFIGFEAVFLFRPQFTKSNHLNFHFIVRLLKFVFEPCSYLMVQLLFLVLFVMVNK